MWMIASSLSKQYLVPVSSVSNERVQSYVVRLRWKSKPLSPGTIGLMEKSLVDPVPIWTGCILSIPGDFVTIYMASLSVTRSSFSARPGNEKVPKHGTYAPFLSVKKQIQKQHNRKQGAPSYHYLIGYPVRQLTIGLF